MGDDIFQDIDRFAKGAVVGPSCIKFHTAQEDAINLIGGHLLRLAQEIREKRIDNGVPTANFKSSDTDCSPLDRATQLKRDFVHNVFVVDGDRGSGKTSVLQTIIRRQQDEDQNRFSAAARQSSPAICIVQIPLVDRTTSQFSAIGALFAAVERLLDQRASDSSLPQVEQEAVRAAKTELHEHVISGWTFSLKDDFGMRALINDAVDYRDYAVQRAKFNQKSTYRQLAWFGFIERFLDTLGYDLFVPAFDDIDLHAASAHNVVEDIKEFLSHPRIAVLAAFDMENLWSDILASHYYENRHEFGAQFDLTDATHFEPHNEARYLLTDLRRQRETIARADLIKTFPAAYRHDIRVRTRRQIDGLFKNWELSKICMFQFLLHHLVIQNMDRFNKLLKVSLPSAEGDPINRNDFRHEKIAWWFFNAEYSALLTDNIRTYTQFFHQISLSSRTTDLNKLVHGGEPTEFPVVKHKNCAVVLANHFGLRGITTHFVGWASSLEALFYSLQSGWLFNASQPGSYDESGYDDWYARTDNQRAIRGLCSRVEEGVVDFIVDVCIGSEHLNAVIVAGLSQWLPKNILGEHCQKGSASESPSLRHGVSSLFSGQALPYSCLYLYQLRHLDRLAARIRRKFDVEKFVVSYRAPDVISKTELATFYREEGVGDGELEYYVRPQEGQNAHEVFARLTSIDEIGNSFPIVSPRHDVVLTIEKRLSRGTPDPHSEREEFQKYKDRILLLHLACDFIRPKENNAAQLAWNAMCSEKSSETGGGPKEIAVSDLVSSERVIEALQRRTEDARDRRYFVTMWIFALEIGKLGANFNAINADETIPPVSVGYLESDEGRLVRLVEETIQIMNSRSPRTVVLLARSLAPVIEPLIALGCGMGEKIDTAIENWKKIKKCLQNAYEVLEGVKEGKVESSCGDIPFSDSRKSFEEWTEKHSGFSSKLPEDWKTNICRDWYFPDFSEDMLGEASVEIEKSISRCEIGLNALDNARGIVSECGNTEREAFDKIAYLLGVSSGYLYNRVS